MRAKIVKLKNGNYAVRKWSFYYIQYLYADINDIEKGNEIYWWTDIFPENYSIKDLDKLEKIVENYKKLPKVEEPKEIVIKKIKL